MYRILRPLVNYRNSTQLTINNENPTNNLTAVPFRYCLSFITLLKPMAPTKKITSIFRLPNIKNKLFLKQSYLLLSLIYTIFQKVQTGAGMKLRYNYFISARKSNILTVTKAPMAHKQWSREQYAFKYYVIIVNVRGTWLQNLALPKSLNQLLWFINWIKVSRPISTNLLLQKSTKFQYSFYDQNFFKL